MRFFKPSEPPNVEKLEAEQNVNELIKALAYKKDRNVQLNAAKALGRLKAVRAIETLLHIPGQGANDEATSIAIESLRQIGSPAIEPLIRVLLHKKLDDGWNRANAIQALGKLRDSRAVEPLISALKDDSDYTRLLVVKALKEIGDPRAVEPLIGALKDKDQHVRLSAAQALEKLGDPQVVKPLIAASKDINIEVGMSISEVIKLLGQPRDAGVSGAELLGSKATQDARFADTFLSFEENPEFDYSIRFSGGKVVSVQKYAKRKK